MLMQDINLRPCGRGIVERAFGRRQRKRSRVSSRTHSENSVAPTCWAGGIQLGRMDAFLIVLDYSNYAALHKIQIKSFSWHCVWVLCISALTVPFGNIAVCRHPTLVKHQSISGCDDGHEHRGDGCSPPPPMCSFFSLRKWSLFARKQCLKLQ